MATRTQASTMNDMCGCSLASVKNRLAWTTPGTRGRSLDTVAPVGPEDGWLSDGSGSDVEAAFGALIADAVRTDFGDAPALVSTSRA